MLAQMSTQIDASWLLCYWALALLDRGVWCALLPEGSASPRRACRQRGHAARSRKVASASSSSGSSTAPRRARR